MSAVAAPAARGLLLTFDDRHVREWDAVRPLLREYDARVTFFVCEPDRLDRDERRLLRGLADDGHSIGCHGLRHRRAPGFIAEHGERAYLEQEVLPCLAELRALGCRADSFAYPNSDRDERSDRLLLTLFSRLRAGAPGAGRADPALADALHVPGEEIASRRVLPSTSADTGRGAALHGSDLSGIEASLTRASRQGGFVTLYVHCVSDGHPHANYVTPDHLRRLLGRAAAVDLPRLGFDDLPPTSKDCATDA
ncbi:hypothetical protein AQ490_05585 [Wenjunlia vitaminophila]|uniref:NodB homology domain-containing protein n=1 Tax=Wenjunlia vitaminophila TaxID=76728 RepID=A0A0T6LP07_WENVI|nr:polysaccharide deacetylase family protein [Wenjunlia vitaminophila]KRV47834.1 hypothetical protein AQ490_05585 [Wenjunlia vitaminophila]